MMEKVLRMAASVDTVRIVAEMYSEMSTVSFRPCRTNIAKAAVMTRICTTEAAIPAVETATSHTGMYRPPSPNAGLPEVRHSDPVSVVMPIVLVSSAAPSA